MPTTIGESWKFDDSEAGTERQVIQLIPAPKPKTDDGFVSTNAMPQVQLWQPSPGTQNTDALDTLFGPPPERPAHTLANPQRKQGNDDAPNPQALAGAGGGGSTGSSTTNPSGGGSGGGGSGGGPGIINANQFLTAYLNMVGSALGPNAVPVALPAGTAAPAVQTAPAHQTEAVAPAKHAMTALTPTAGSLHSFTPLLNMPTNPPVLDMNTGEVIPANVTLNSFSGWGENLLAQSTGTVLNYTWDVSQAPDLTNVTTGGPLGGNLQGTWAPFTGTPRTDTITVTENFTNQTTAATTVTYLVAGTDSPAYSASRPTSAATWPAVLTPDMVSSGQATAGGGPFGSAGLTDGSAQTSFTMPSYNPCPTFRNVGRLKG